MLLALGTDVCDFEYFADFVRGSCPFEAAYEAGTVKFFDSDGAELMCRFFAGFRVSVSEPASRSYFTVKQGHYKDNIQR